MPDLIGSTLGPYRILEQIGLGGMATVYKAYQPGMDRLVALKVLPEHYAAQPKFAQRFEREARIIAKLEHRNILPVYDFGQAGGLTYLVMRYLQAGTVKDILSHGPLPLGDAARVLSDVASALDYAHAQGIVHRDVKPSNILVDTQGSAYLTDFGIAKVLEGTQELTGTSTLGTPAYMAPEQTLGKPVTPQSDVYSLGVMLYEMVTGRAPFESDTPMAVALMHVHEPLPLPRRINPQIPEQVELVILKALAKEPKDRYASAGDLARAFSAAVGAELSAVPSRLLELAGVAATGKGSEEITYDVREEVRRRESTERRRRAMRWAPFAVGGVIAVVLIGLALSYASGQTTSAQATMFAAASVTARPTYTPPPTAIPTATPLPSPTAIPFAWARIESAQFIRRDAITAIVIDPRDPDVIYVGTENAGIYKSINGGLSWQPAHTGLTTGSVYNIVLHPADSQTLFASVLSGGLLISMDGGLNWSPITVADPSSPYCYNGMIAVDPRDLQRLMWAGCGSPAIYQSADGGATWSALASYQGSNCPNDVGFVAFHPLDSKVLFATQWTTYAPECPRGLYVSTDSGQSWTLTEVRADSLTPHNIAIQQAAAGPVFFAVGEQGEIRASSGDGVQWNSNLAANGPCTDLTASLDATAYAVCGGYLYKTVDGGETWPRVSESRPVFPIGTLAVSPRDPNTVFVGDKGLYVSTDGGVTWKEISSGLPAIRISLDLGPTDSRQLFTHEVEPFATDTRLYFSSDSGQNWNLLTERGFGLAFGDTGQTLYRGGYGSVWRSVNMGQTWQTMAIPFGGRTIIEADPVSSRRLYVTGLTPPYIYLSEDDGVTWIETLGIRVTAENAEFSPHQLHDLFFAPAAGEIIYAIGAYNLSPAYSLDGGGNWQMCHSPGLPGKDRWRLAIDPRDSNHLYLARQSSGVLISTDGCQSWQPSNTGLGSLFVNTVAIDPNIPDTVYAGTDGGAHVSFDGGAHWGPINDGLLGALVIYSIVIDPQSNVYAATPYGIFKLQPR